MAHRRLSIKRVRIASLGDVTPFCGGNIINDKVLGIKTIVFERSLNFCVINLMEFFKSVTVFIFLIKKF